METRANEMNALGVYLGDNDEADAEDRLVATTGTTWGQVQDRRDQRVANPRVLGSSTLGSMMTTGRRFSEAATDSRFVQGAIGLAQMASGAATLSATKTAKGAHKLGTNLGDEIADRKSNAGRQRALDDLPEALAAVSKLRAKETRRTHKAICPGTTCVKNGTEIHIRCGEINQVPFQSTTYNCRRCGQTQENPNGLSDVDRLTQQVLEYPTTEAMKARLGYQANTTSGQFTDMRRVAGDYADDID